MSMKIDEVMLGDIVSAGGIPIHVTLAVLNNWSDNIKPIPLTPEILENNGFENQGFRHHDEYNGIDDRVVLRNKRECINSDNEWRVLIESEDYRSIAHCELTYVHELQNILRLCKIDKEIVV